jgi:hypothetical protein
MSQSANESGDAGAEGVDEATRSEEGREASAPHAADRPPTAEEAAAAESIELDPEVAAHEREMDKLGAEVKGEGEIG